MNKSGTTTYEGEFSFIPTYNQNLPGGIYIFQGARIDEEADEVVPGLFVSREHFLDHPVIFSRARPDYLAKLKLDFETAQSKFAADSHAQAVARGSERQSRENFGLLLGVMGGLLAMGNMGSMSELGDVGSIGGLLNNFGGGSSGGVQAMTALIGGGRGGGLGNLQSASLAVLINGILGGKSSGEMLTGVVSMVMQQGKSVVLAGDQTDPAAGLIASLSQLAQSNTTMTRKQYAAQFVGAAVAGIAQHQGQAAPGAFSSSVPCNQCSAKGGGCPAGKQPEQWGGGWVEYDPVTYAAFRTRTVGTECHARQHLPVR